MNHEEVDNGFLDALANDTERLVSLLAVDVSGIKKFDIGSDRYKTVSSAYEQLAYASKLPGVRWETELPHNRRNGEYLMEKLYALKQQLNYMGEGAGWKGVASA